MHASSRLLIWSFVAITIGACASAQVPVRNFSAVPIGAKSNPTLDEVGKAIVKAGVAAGWQMSDVKPGYIIGTYRIRNHQAIVDVTYTATTYDITFKSGDQGLRYDGQNIHQNYNGWVENLEVLIRSHVNAL